jgi:hypothetical protein
MQLLILKIGKILDLNFDFLNTHFFFIQNINLIDNPWMT